MTALRAFLLVLGAVLLATPGCGDDTRPNIVLMIGDDHGFPDFGFTGSRYVQTPNLDTLAADGSVFLRGYSTASHCRPSLATLLTGLYPYQWNRRVRSLLQTHADLAEHFAIEHFDTLPRLLASRGYRTFQGGKHWEGTFQAAGFSDGMIDTYDEERPWGGEGIKLGRSTMEPVYDFIDAHRDGPFFIWFAPMLPHLPHTAPKEFQQRYQRNELSRFAERYFAACTWYDHLVGQLVEYIESRGLSEKTLFVYLSDNGWDQSPTAERRGRIEGLLGGPKGKASMYELGFRTPIVFHWPGRVESGRRVEALVSTVDVLPTLLDYAGVAIPGGLPGRSLRPWLEGGRGPGRRHVVGSAGILRRASTDDDELFTDEDAFYIQTPDWYLIDYQDRGAVELYDMRADPEQNRDVAALHPAIVEALREEIARWKQSVVPP
jgi:uncharacterized sulfatase